MPAFPEFEHTGGKVNLNPAQVISINENRGGIVTVLAGVVSYNLVGLTREQVVAKLCLQGPADEELVAEAKRNLEWLRYSPTETAPTEPALKGVKGVHLGPDGSLVAVTRDGSAVHTIDEGGTWVNSARLHRLVLELLRDPMLPGAEYHRGIGPRIKPLRDLLGLTDRVEWSRESRHERRALVLRVEGTWSASIYRSLVSESGWIVEGWGHGVSLPDEAAGIAKITAWGEDEDVAVPPVPPHLLHDPDLRKLSAEDALTAAIVRTAPEESEKAGWVQHTPGEVKPQDHRGEAASPQRIDITIAGQDVVLISTDGRDWTPQGFTLHEGAGPEPRAPDPDRPPAYLVNDQEGVRAVLRELGIPHSPVEHPSGRWALFDVNEEEELYRGSCADIWAWLRQSGRIA